MSGRTPRFGDRGENDRKILSAIERAAKADRPCPTNDELAGMVGAVSPSYGAGVIRRLEQAGLIKVERFNMARRVTIRATGASTFYDGSAKPHWRSPGGVGLRPPVDDLSQMSGGQLARLIERRASEIGIPVTAFARACSENTTQWLKQLAEAKRPKPMTVERIRQLLAGAEVAPPPANNFQASPRKPSAARSVGVTPDRDPEPRGPRVYRDPCFRCGARGDLGCEHQQPVREWAA